MTAPPPTDNSTSPARPGISRKRGTHHPSRGGGCALAVLLCVLAGCGSTPPRPAAAPAAEAPVAQPPPPPPGAAKTEDEGKAPAPPVAKSEPSLAANNSIFFSSGSSRIDAAGEARLREHAARLKAAPKLDVILVGHTDNLGSTAYNLAIAEQRAAAVARALQAMGVSRRQLRHYGVGDEKGGPTCRSAACRQQKRRVDVVYPE